MLFGLQIGGIERLFKYQNSTAHVTLTFEREINLLKILGDFMGDRS